MIKNMCCLHADGKKSKGQGRHCRGHFCYIILQSRPEQRLGVQYLLPDLRNRSLNIYKMGKVFSSAIKRPTQNWNLENRAHRILEKKKPTIAPSHNPTLTQQFRTGESSPSGQGVMSSFEDHLGSTARVPLPTSSRSVPNGSLLSLTVNATSIIITFRMIYLASLWLSLIFHSYSSHPVCWLYCFNNWDLSDEPSQLKPFICYDSHWLLKITKMSYDDYVKMTFVSCQYAWVILYNPSYHAINGGRHEAI